MANTIVCGRCYGAKEIRRHGEPEPEACPLCGARGYIVTETEPIPGDVVLHTDNPITRAKWTVDDIAHAEFGVSSVRPL